MEGQGSGPSRPSRRRVLAGIGAGSLAGLAGCPGIGGRTTNESPTASPTPTAVPPDWAEGGPPNREEWEVTLAERFADGDLDRSRWQNGFGELSADCPAFEGPDHCAVADNSAVSDDRLVLSATTDTPAIPEDEQVSWREEDPSYSVGAVHTQNAFEQEFGYFEAKARVEVAAGTMPAFWLFKMEEGTHREIDVEFVGKDPNRLINFLVIYENGDDRTDRESFWYQFDAATPTDEAFQVWGLEWTPETIAIDVNGERIHTFDHHEVEQLHGEPLHLVLNHGVFEPPHWAGDPSPSDFPLEFEAEWVRVWQREDLM